LNSSRTKIKIPILAETAADPEIQEAWEILFDLQKRLQEKQKEVARVSKMLYDRYELLKKRAISPKMDIEGCRDLSGEEKSRAVRKDLSRGREPLVSNQALLTEVDEWRSK
jgi:hypothetical protein